MSAPADTPVVLSVGVTGHRKLGDDPAVLWYVHAECVRVLDRLRGVAGLSQSSVVAYTGLAVGADQEFGRAAVGLGIPLVGIVPYDGYPADFDGRELEDYHALLLRCREVLRLPHKRRSNKAYMDAGKWLVDRAEFLVAVWDGQPAAGLGGTADVVAYARKKRRTIIRIDPAEARSSR